MKRHCVRHNIWYYSTLVLIFTLGIILILQTTDQKMQIIIVLITAFFYVLWGIIHHLLHHSLTAKIVLEYSLIGSLGMSLIFFLLRGVSL